MIVKLTENRFLLLVQKIELTQIMRLIWNSLWRKPPRKTLHAVNSVLKENTFSHSFQNYYINQTRFGTKGETGESSPHLWQKLSVFPSFMPHSVPPLIGDYILEKKYLQELLDKFNKKYCVCWTVSVS